MRIKIADKSEKKSGLKEQIITADKKSGLKEQIKEQIIIADKKSGLKMFSTRYFRFLIVAAAALAACTDDPVDPAESTGTGTPEDAEPASLTINFSIADLGIDVSTRAGAGDLGGTGGGDASDNTDTPTGTTGTPGTLLPDNDVYGNAEMIAPDYPWPEIITPESNPDGPNKQLSPAQHIHNYNVAEAALVDGSMLTCLTVILVNYHENKIVAVRRIPDPNCPNHDVKYREGTQSYPPTDTAEIRKAKRNCILVKNKQGGFDLAPVLTDKDGTVKKDSLDHITGLIGTHACVTLEYENPIHVVNRNELTVDGTDNGAIKKDYRDSVEYVGKSAEKLVRGEYTILVIANYDHRVTTAPRQGGSTENYPTLNVDTELEKLADKFHYIKYRAEGIPDFRSKYQYLYDLRFLMNRTLVKDGANEDVAKLGPNKDGSLKPFIRPAVHQTLTAAKDIYLEAGNNVINVELQRIASRTRIEVKNYAKDQPLKVHSLEFSKNYTQSTCYLFRRNKVDRDYKELSTKKTEGYTGPALYSDHDGKGDPMVDYTGIYNYFDGKTYGAIVPFIKETWDGETTPSGVKVEPGKKRCIFDALMYESHLDYKDEADDPDSFTYTIDVSYPGVTNYKTPDLNKLDHEKSYTTEYDPDRAKFDYVLTQANGQKDFIQTTDVESFYNKIEEIEATFNKDADGNTLNKGESLCFFIQCVGQQDYAKDKFIYEKEDGTLYAEKTDINLDTESIDLKSYLWQLDGLVKDADGKYRCYLKNLRSGKHMPTLPQCVEPTAASHMMSTNETTDKYILGVVDGYVTFSNHFDAGYYYNWKQRYDSYLSVWGNTPYLSGWHTADLGCEYKLYPIKISPTLVYVGTPRMKKTVELTAFSDATGYVEKVREIKRNDFIRILVEVSYNPDASDFWFKVKPWDKSNGAVEFH